MLLETNIDDMNPEIYSYIFEKLFKAGALDVYLTPIIMKKNRPGVQLSVLVNPDTAEEMKVLLFKETTTLGIRVKRIERVALKRRFAEKETPFGKITFKEAYLDGRLIKSTPEYEDCRKAALANDLPLRAVYDQLQSIK